MFSLIIFLDRGWQILGLIHADLIDGHITQKSYSLLVLENNCNIWFLYIHDWCLFWDVISLYPIISYTGTRAGQVGGSFMTPKLFQPEQWRHPVDKQNHAGIDVQSKVLRASFKKNQQVL